MSEENLWERKRITKEIINCGCCGRCALRYLNVSSYDKPDTQLALVGVRLDVQDPSTTKPCSICVGCLDDSIIEEILNHPSLQDVSQFKSESFYLHVKLPMIIPVRDKSMLVHLKDKFPQYEISRLFVDKAIKRVLATTLAKRFDKIYEKDSRFGIYIHISYEDDFKESVTYRPLRTQKTKQKRHSRSGIIANLKTCPFERMKQFIPVPPRPPSTCARLVDVVCRIETFHLTGRYCKYARNLAQYIKNNPNGNSIEKIMVDALTTVLGPAQYVFKGVGYDDPDDRVLEKGRLFSIQVFDSYFTTISMREFELIESLIKKDGLVEVFNLHNISRKYLGEIVEAEKLKNRHLRLYCRLMSKHIDQCIDQLNELGEIHLTQRTPIRLLHDRDCTEVTKTIFKIHAELVEDTYNLIQIEIESQTGFQLPEFVHGDLGRTVPNLCDILQQPVEFVALDVLINTQ